METPTSTLDATAPPAGPPARAPLRMLRELAWMILERETEFEILD